MANVKVEIKIAVQVPVKELYLVGSVSQLGAWDVKKAIKMEYCNECNKFVVNKMLPAGESVEFKVLNSKSWDNVEKGYNGEELENHTIVPQKGLSVEVEVVNFAQ